MSVGAETVTELTTKKSIQAWSQGVCRHMLVAISGRIVEMSTASIQGKVYVLLLLF